MAFCSSGGACPPVTWADALMLTSIGSTSSMASRFIDLLPCDLDPRRPKELLVDLDHYPNRWGAVRTEESGELLTRELEVGLRCLRRRRHESADSRAGSVREAVVVTDRQALPGLRA